MIRSIETSRRIVGAIVLLNLHYEMGTPLKDFESAAEAEVYLRQYTLADLLDANHIASLNAREPNTSGGQTLHVTCADKIIAAVFTALHHDPQPNNGPVVPIFELHDRALALVEMKRGEEKNDGIA